MDIAITEPDGQLALREANHRFLNTLTALSLQLRSDFDGFVEPAVRDAVSVFSGRIQAFAGLLWTLDKLPAGAMVDAPAHLARLCAELCTAYLEPRGVHCDFSADPVILPRESCRTLGLIVVELVTNAAKHAFVGRRSGRVGVSLRRAGAGWICQVADDGCGIRGGPARNGTRLVEGLATTLGGNLRVHSDGGGTIVSLSWVEDQATLRGEAVVLSCQA